jgi:hypothetical protein
MPHIEGRELILMHAVMRFCLRLSSLARNTQNGDTGTNLPGTIIAP